MTEQDVLIAIAIKNKWNWPDIHKALVDRTTPVESEAAPAVVGFKTIAKNLQFLWILQHCKQCQKRPLVSQRSNLI